MGVAGKNFVTQGVPFRADSQADADLFAIRAMVARVASAGLRISFSFAFKVSGGQIVKQKFIGNTEEPIPLFFDVGFQHLFERKNFVQAPVKPVIIDFIFGKPQDVGQGCFSQPILGYMEFA